MTATTAKTDARDAIVSVRLPREQQELLRRLASAAGRSLSDYVRSVVSQSAGLTDAAAVHVTTTNSSYVAPVIGAGLFIQGPTDEHPSSGTLYIRA